MAAGRFEAVRGAVVAAWGGSPSAWGGASLRGFSRSLRRLWEPARAGGLLVIRAWGAGRVARNPRQRTVNDHSPPGGWASGEKPPCRDARSTEAGPGPAATEASVPANPGASERFALDLTPCMRAFSTSLRTGTGTGTGSGSRPRRHTGGYETGRRAAPPCPARVPGDRVTRDAARPVLTVNGSSLSRVISTLVACVERRGGRGGCPIGTLAAALADTDDGLRISLREAGATRSGAHACACARTG
jgi:hypothetical protein